MAPVTDAASAGQNNKKQCCLYIYTVISHDLNIASVIGEMTGRWENSMLSRMNKMIYDQYFPTKTTDFDLKLGNLQTSQTDTCDTDL